MKTKIDGMSTEINKNTITATYKLISKAIELLAYAVVQSKNGTLYLNVEVIIAQIKNTPTATNDLIENLGNPQTP